MKKSVTYKQIQTFDNVATQFLIRNGYFTPPSDPGKLGSFTKKENTMLASNMRNVVKQWTKHFEVFAELVEDLKLDHCLKDEKTKAILRDEHRNLRFSVEGERDYKKAYKELIEQTVDIHVRITKDEDLAENEINLTDDEIEAFNGIIIPERKLEETEN